MNEILPNEILVIIFKLIPVGGGLLRIANVCRKWRSLIQSTPNLRHRLTYKMQTQIQLDQLKQIPDYLRLDPPNLCIYKPHPYQDVDLQDPFWKSSSSIFESITLDLDSNKTPLNSVLSFLEGFTRCTRLNFDAYYDCISNERAHRDLKTKRDPIILQLSRNLIHLQICDYYFPFASGIDESFLQLVNLKHLHIMLENTSWRCPKSIANGLETFSLHVMGNTHDDTTEIIRDMINLKSIKLSYVTSPEILTFISRTMPHLESIKIENCYHVIGSGFDAKGLSKLRKLALYNMHKRSDYCIFHHGSVASSVDLAFENLKILILEDFDPRQLAFICRQNPGLQRVDVSSGYRTFVRKRYFGCERVDRYKYFLMDSIAYLPQI